MIAPRVFQINSSYYEYKQFIFSIRSFWLNSFQYKIAEVASDAGCCLKTTEEYFKSFADWNILELDLNEKHKVTNIGIVGITSGEIYFG